MKTLPDPKAWLDAQMATTFKDPRGEPDLWIICKMDSYDRETDKPIAIFKTREALYKHFPAIVAKADPRFGLGGYAWWFDDEEVF